jgi:hypothetical protein
MSSLLLLRNTEALNKLTEVSTEELDNVFKLTMDEHDEQLQLDNMFNDLKKLKLSERESLLLAYVITQS